MIADIARHRRNREKEKITTEDTKEHGGERRSPWARHRTLPAALTHALTLCDLADELPPWCLPDGFGFLL